jgi:large subunit ribosomal protein L4
MPKKMRQGALRSALSERVREGKVVLIDGWTLDKPKTKDFIASLQRLGLEGKTLIVDSLDNDNLMLSTRNVQSAKVVNSFGLNIYDLLYHERLVISEAAVKELEQMLGPKKESAAGPEPEEETNAEAAAAEPAKPKRARKPAVKGPKAAPKRKKEAA